jgi:hypothetical protein
MAQEQSQGGATVQTLEGTSLLDDILSETKMTPGDEGYEVAKRGVQAFIAELIAPKREGEKVDKALVDALIAEIDVKLSRQIDEILHHPTYQKLESAWRGLKFVVDRTDFRENVKIELLNCSKEDLIADFEDALRSRRAGCTSSYIRLSSASSAVGLTVRSSRTMTSVLGRRILRFCRSARRWRRCRTRRLSRRQGRSSSGSRII